jgi:hypothetical protein
MKTKWFMLFAVAALSIASAKNGVKSYELSFDQPAKVGNVQLAAGHYSMKVDASTVHFKNLETGKTADVTGKVSAATSKFDSTSSVSNSDKGTLNVKEIDLGGTTTKIEFESLP